jgi:arsenate reductase-like glutaredoxin family protein
MAHKSKAKTPIISDHLIHLLDEMADEFEKTIELRRRLLKEKNSEKSETLESELYVALVCSEVKLRSVIEEWDRLVDEELED